MPRGVYKRKRMWPKNVDPARLREMVECGYTRMEAAEEFGFGERWIRKLAARIGLRFPRKGGVRPEARLRVINAVQAGYDTCPKIAVAVERCLAQVHVIVRQLLEDGILRRVKLPRVRIMHLKVADWWMKDESLARTESSEAV